MSVIHQGGFEPMARGVGRPTQPVGQRDVPMAQRILGDFFLIFLVTELSYVIF